VGTRASLDAVEKRKLLTSLGLELNSLVVPPVSGHYTDCTIPACNAMLKQLYQLNYLGL
jgi:hypothetical protein